MKFDTPHRKLSPQQSIEILNNTTDAIFDAHYDGSHIYVPLSFDYIRYMEQGKKREGSFASSVRQLGTQTSDVETEFEEFVIVN